MRDSDSSSPLLTEMLHHRASAEGDTIAYGFLRDDGTRDVITNAQLDHRARSIGRHLQESGLNGQCVVLLYPPGLEFVAAFLGCLYAGAVAVPADPPRPKRPVTRLRAVFTDSRALAALTCSDFDGHVAGWINTDSDLGDVEWIRSDRIPGEPDSVWTLPSVSSDSLALLQYTSGSTGEPKGVMVTHGNLMHNLSAIHKGFDIDRAGMGVSWLPIYHDMGLVGGILQPLFAGGPVTLLSPLSFLRNPFRWLQTIHQFGGTISGGPNFAYEMCVDRITPEQRDQLDLSKWRTAYCGAEPIRWQTLERFGDFFAPCGFRMEAFYPCYGMAESTLMVTGGDANSAPCVLSADKSDLQNHVVTITSRGTNGSTVSLVGCGRGLLGQEVAIVDPESRVLQDECRVGEIWVRGRSVAQGYWKRTQLTQETFQGRLAGDDQEGFLRTGDLGFLYDSELYVTGRLKDLIIVRGRNHYPQDIEQTVETSHESLRTMGCAAFGVEIDDEERLVVVQEVQRGVRKSETKALLDIIREAIVREHGIQAHTVVLVKTLSIPKTSSGKIQRHATRQQYLDGTLSELGRCSVPLPRPASAPSTAKSRGDKAPAAVTAAAIQQWLIEAIADRLGDTPERIDAHKPFEALGLDSLAAVRLIADLAAWLDRPVSPTLIYECCDIASLAAHLAGKRPAPESVETGSPQRFAEPIAIVGMACRFPGGANDPDSFWRLMATGVDAIGEVPDDRWDVDALYDADPSAAGKMSTRWGGFIDGVELFDPQFFGIAPREARSMDPQQRLLLEVAWEALEHAGLSPARLEGTSTGVFTGICNDDYSRLMQASGERSQIDAYYGTGCAFSVAAGRLSYVLGVQGPSLSVDTACSSSLVALHLACQSLSRGECRTALVGGVNLLLSPDAMVYFSKVRAMAADGRCKAFDRSADGYVRGEGCGVVVLKRLSAAVQDGDRILATIRGTAVNHDGSSNGLTAPNPVSQEQVIRQALAVAGVEPGDIDYVEAHGTGTPLGDPVEVRALNAVFSPDRDPRSGLKIASVKTNIGHLEAAAGVAGLIKTVLSLSHRAIPPHLHLQQVNPQIPLDQMPISVPTRLTPWQSAGRRRMAGVSSFGFSGTNAHVIVEEAPEFATAPRLVERPVHVLTLSAKSEASLRELVRNYISRLQDDRPISLADFCHTASVGRSHFPHRLAVSATSTALLSEKLTGIAARQHVVGAHWGHVAPRPPDVAFIFADQRPLRPEIGRELYETQPAFRDLVDHCDDIHPRGSLVGVLTNERGDGKPLASTASISSAAFTFQYALAQMWRSWGIAPCLVAGDGLGELVAACLAEVLCLEEALWLAAAAEDAQVAGSFTRDADNVDSAFCAILSQLEFGEPTIPLASCRTGRLTELHQLRSEAYWLQCLRAPTAHDINLKALETNGCGFAIEMGPATTPSDCGAQGSMIRLPSLGSRIRHWEVLADSLAQLYVAGVDVDWSGFDRGYARRRLTLPTYPFQRKRYWFDAPTHDAPAAEAATPSGNESGHGNGNGKAARESRESLPQQILSARPALRPGLIAVYLKRQLAAELDVDETDIDVERPVSEMGLDSLMITAILLNIKDDLDFNVYPREVYAHPTIATLAEYMAKELNRFHKGEDTVIENGEIASPGPLSPIVHPLFAEPLLSGDRVKDTVFVLSAPRSGSTLLRVMLAGHAQLFSPPELHLLPFDHMGQRRERLSESHLGEGLSRALMELQGISAEEANERIAAWADQETPVDEVYRALAAAVSPRQLVDKSPTYAGRPEILQRAETWFESPKYVFLMRNPLAVIESLVRMRMDKLVGDSVENPYLWAEEVWRSANRNVMDFFENIDPQRRIILRFESLVTHPKSEMERLAEFLHVPYDGALVTPYAGSRMTDAATSGAVPIDDPNFLAHSGIDASLAETWRNVSLPYPLADETKELARRLDYDVAAVTTSAQVTPKAKQTSSIAASDRSNGSKDQRRAGGTSRNVSSMDEVFIEANGLRLCVCTWGPADGPVVLCFHGILDQGACWQLVARRLVRRGYRVIAPDFRGHGRSDHIGAGCSYHFLDFVGDADAVLRTLGDQPVSLVGHSLGAIVAAQLALARADRIADLTVVEPPLQRSTASKDQRSLTAYLDYTATPPVHKPLADTQAAVDRLRFAMPGMSENLARDLARRSTEKMAEGLQWRWDARLQARGGLAHAANQFTREVFCGVISDLTMPVTLVQGTDGMTKLDDRMGNAVQRVVACVTVDGGHHLTIEAPDQIAEAIAAIDPSRAESVMLQRCSV